MDLCFWKLSLQENPEITYNFELVYYANTTDVKLDSRNLYDSLTHKHIIFKTALQTKDEK